MRLNPAEGETASMLLRRLNERDLADLFWKFGEERHSRRIARKIVETRRRTPLETTQQLADLVRRCVPRSRRPAIDPATRVFQALRIAVNDELGQLERALPLWIELLKPGGRLGVISFHSLEDRLVKQALSEVAGNRYDAELRLLTKKPVSPSSNETVSNPRARSARLRAAVKIKKKGN